MRLRMKALVRYIETHKDYFVNNESELCNQIKDYFSYATRSLDSISYTDHAACILLPQHLKSEFLTLKAESSYLALARLTLHCVPTATEADMQGLLRNLVQISSLFIATPDQVLVKQVRAIPSTLSQIDIPNFQEGIDDGALISTSQDVFIFQKGLTVVDISVSCSERSHCKRLECGDIVCLPDLFKPLHCVNSGGKFRLTYSNTSELFCFALKSAEEGEKEAELRAGRGAGGMLGVYEHLFETDIELNTAPVQSIEAPLTTPSLPTRYAFYFLPANISSNNNIYYLLKGRL